MSRLVIVHRGYGFANIVTAGYHTEQVGRFPKALWAYDFDDCRNFECVRVCIHFVEATQRQTVMNR